MAPITYIIADDHLIFRQGLRYALSNDPSLSLAGEADNGVSLLQLLRKKVPDVILLDLNMPQMNGIEAAKSIREHYPLVKILMLTSYDDEHFILHLIECGANGYLLKNVDPDEIRRAIHTVYKHDYYFNHLLGHTMLKTISQKKKAAVAGKSASRLTEREEEVLKLICQELTAAEIGAKIYLSPRTVEGIRTSLIEKTGVKNVAGLVLYAIRNGIIE